MDIIMQYYLLQNLLNYNSGVGFFLYSKAHCVWNLIFLENIHQDQSSDRFSLGKNAYSVKT